MQTVRHPPLRQLCVFNVFSAQAHGSNLNVTQFTPPVAVAGKWKRSVSEATFTGFSNLSELIFQWVSHLPAVSHSRCGNSKHISRTFHVVLEASLQSQDAAPPASFAQGPPLKQLPLLHHEKQPESTSSIRSSFRTERHRQKRNIEYVLDHLCARQQSRKPFAMSNTLAQCSISGTMQRLLL